MKDKKLLFGLLWVGVLNMGLFGLENPLDLAVSLAKKNWLSLTLSAGQGDTSGETLPTEALLRIYALEIRALLARGYTAQESSAMVRQKMYLDLALDQDRQIRTRLKSLEEKQALRNMDNPARRFSDTGPASAGQGGPDHRLPGGRN